MVPCRLREAGSDSRTSWRRHCARRASAERRLSISCGVSRADGQSVRHSARHRAGVLFENPRRLRPRSSPAFEMDDEIAAKGWWRSAHPRRRIWSPDVRASAQVFASLAHELLSSSIASHSSASSLPCSSVRSGAPSALTRPDLPVFPQGELRFCSPNPAYTAGLPRVDSMEETASHHLGGLDTLTHADGAARPAAAGLARKALHGQLPIPANDEHTIRTQHATRRPLRHSPGPAGRSRRRNPQARVRTPGLVPIGAHRIETYTVG